MTRCNRSYRAFSRDAAGFVLGEGSGILILEELEHALQRDAKIYAEVIGYGASSDAYHVMIFDPQFDQPVAAIETPWKKPTSHLRTWTMSMRTASRFPPMTAPKSRFSSSALGEAMSKIPVSATKPLTGHVLGGGGALELIGCCLMLEHQFLHPTINLSETDPSYGLDFIPEVGRHEEVDRCSPSRLDSVVTMPLV